MTVQIRIAETEADQAACMTLRWSVFVKEQGVPPDDELDGTDLGCTHILALDGKTPVGAARYKVVSGTAKIGRVCVVRNRRGQGVGAALIEYVCQNCSADRALLGAQTSALRFYERLGFEPIGATYFDAGIAHQDMEKMLCL